MKSFAQCLKEGVEHGDTPKPKHEYFLRPFAISGKIVQLYPVYDVPVKTVQYQRKLARARTPAERERVQSSASVWRWRVRIQTDEGWMLMGYIGKTDRKEDLPPIRQGDTVEVRNLILDTHTGGAGYMESGLWRGRYTVSDTKVDYRDRNLDRQLHGKVKRAAVHEGVAAPSRVRAARKPLRVFDFDDTLAHAGSAVGVMRGGKRVRELSSLTFKDYTLQPGEEFDFSGADRVVDPKPIGAVLKVLRAVLSQGKPAVILTGRKEPQPVRDWLESVGLRGIQVVAIGHDGATHHSIAAAKRDWLVGAIGRGYNDIEFWDDNATNIKVARTIKREYPHIRFITRLVRYTAR
jgi:hypothetical protein